MRLDLRVRIIVLVALVGLTGLGLAGGATSGTGARSPHLRQDRNVFSSWSPTQFGAFWTNLFGYSQPNWLLAPRAVAIPFATITVTTNLDTIDAAANCSAVTLASLPGPDGQTSLREAICAANNNAGADTINFSVNGTFTLTGAANEDNGGSGDLDIKQSLTINGNGTANTILDGSGTERIFDVFPGAPITFDLSSLTLQNGDTRLTSFKEGGAVYLHNNVTSIFNSVQVINNFSGANGAIESRGNLTINNSVISNNQTIPASGSVTGGGIHNAGTLTIDNTTISNNTVRGEGGGIATSTAAGVTVTITDSTISGNTASVTGGGLGNGGGISTTLNEGTIIITNCTISGNRADNAGGGAYFYMPLAAMGNVTLTNVTITNNTADNDNNNSGVGGGLAQSLEPVTLRNTIIAGNFNSTVATRDDVIGEIVATSSFNLIGDGTGLTGISNGVNNNQVGSGANPINPLLGPLTNNGGPTETHALLTGSPAIDTGSNAFAPASDQRGIVSRPLDGNSDSIPIADIGAYELQLDTTPPDTTITGNPTNPSNSTSATFTFTGSDNITPPGSLTFQCRIDGSSFSACTSPRTYSGLTDGSHTFQVRAIDQAGNTDPTPANYTWTIDATPPNTTILANPTNPSASTTAGFSFNGNDGSGTGVASFQCQLDGGGFSTCTSPQTYTGLANGSHTFQVRAIDGAGNVDPSPASFTWVVDTNGPDTIIVGNPTNPSASANASFSFIGSDSGGSGVVGYECQIDGGGFSSCTSPRNYTALNDGPHTFQVRAIDQAGNTDPTPASYTWTIDTMQPTVGLSSLAPNPTNVSPIPVTVLFGENVTGFTAGDISTSNGTVNNFLGSGSMYTFDLVPSGPGLVTANIAAGVAQDAAGNGNTAATQFSRTYFICPTTLTVNDLGDAPDATPGDGVCATAGNVCTLRAAVQEANAITVCSPLTINFSVTGTINLATALPDLNHPNLTINGPGADMLTVQRSTASGTPDFRIFRINSGTIVSINGLTISNGNAGTGGFGGGILSFGTLSINGCVISGNHAENGGGLSLSAGELTMSNSTVSGNTTTFQGAGIDDIGGVNATLINTTISGNTAGTTPGGIRIFNGGLLTLVNCTVTNNTSQTNFTGGIGTNNSAVTVLRNTVVANNVGVDLRNTGGTVTSLGNNLTSDGGGGFLTGTGDLINTNPLLAALGNYGGATPTHALLPGSPAINAGNNCVLTNACASNNLGFNLTTDQRGITRPQQTTVDIGAYESRGFTLTQVAGGNNQSTIPTTAFANALAVTVSSDFGEPVQGGLVTFTAPGSGPSATLTSPAALNASGQTSVNATANASAGGQYQVTASANGLTATNFNLNNTCPSYSVGTPTATGTIGLSYSSSVAASPAAPAGFAYSYALANSTTLPAGLMLDASTGAITGTPTTVGNISFDIKAELLTSPGNVSTGCSTTVTRSINIGCVTDPIVTSNADSGTGSLREAIAIACPGSTITFANTVVSPISLTSGQLVINKNLTIQGPGANVLTVQRSTASGTPNFRIFNITSGVTATIDALTIANGKVSGGASNEGGGILNSGTLTLSNSTLSGNSVSGSSPNQGGGILNIGTLTLSNSTLSGNSASGGASNEGGGIYNSPGGTMTLTNSTLSGNYASGSISSGGAIFNRGTVTITNSTLSGNSASGGTSSINRGGGIYIASGTVQPRNTIIAGNSVSGGSTNQGPDVWGTISSQGNNLIGNTANSSGWIASDLQNQNPLLAPLGNYGGPTQTHRLLLGSPAINAGNNCVLTANGCGDNNPALTTDQRGTGFPRQIGGTVDIGAFEANYALAATSGTPQSTLINTAFANPLVATLTESGNPVSNVLLTFTAPGSGPSATFPNGNTATTDANGQVSVNVAANTTSGSAYTVTANTTPGLATPASFSLTNTCPTIMAQVGGGGTICPGGQAQVTVTVSGGTAPYTVTLNNGGGTLMGNSPFTFNVSPASTTTYSVQSATDANGCPVLASGSALVTVNEAPTITNPTNQTVLQGGTATFSVTPGGTPTPTVKWQVSTNGGGNYNDIPLATGNTLTLNNVTPAMNGNRYRAIAENTCGTATSMSALLSVNAASAKFDDPLVCLVGGDTGIITAFITNNGAAAVNASYTATNLAPNLIGIPGSGVASVNPANFLVTPTTATWNGVLQPGETVNLLFRVQFAPGLLNGANVCFDATFVIDGNQAQQQICTILNCPVGGVNPAVSAQKPGSLLVFPYYTSKAATKADTRFTLTNLGTQMAYVHLFFIDGTTCQPADQFLCLTPGASYSGKASETDGETTGWILALAVNQQGTPIQYNNLIGNAFVNDGDYVDNYGAEAFVARSPNVAAIQGATALLFFDGVGYDAMPNQFAAEVQSPLNAANQRVVTVGMRGDLNASALTGAAQTGTGLVINGNETPMGSFINWLTGNCQAIATVTNQSPRVPLGMNGVIPNGQHGTIQFRIGGGVGLVMTPKTAPFAGIRALHKTGLTTSTLRIPLLPPVC